MEAIQNNSDSELYINLIESQPCINDRYVDIKRMGQNGGEGYFSLVFTAKDLSSRKKERVVLKFFNPLRTNSYRIECFSRESKMLKELKGQKNIMPLIQEETPITIHIENLGIKFPIPLKFYSSFLANFSISQYIYEETTKHPDLLTNILYFREMCKAVQRIHKRQICHRDLKPSNFFVYKLRHSDRKYVCLGDFGTARYFYENAPTLKTNYATSPGDTRYFAPEFLCGLHISTDHNYYADIYSLGAILFELYTKNILGSVIFQNKAELIAHYMAVPERDRIRVFDETVESLTKDQILPRVRAYDESIPKSIACEVDKIYQSMACLNYKKREVNFDYIFLRINVCEKIIRNYKEYEKWKLKGEPQRKDTVC